jgi:hypothetical protein
MDEIRSQLLASGASEIGSALAETRDQIAVVRALEPRPVDREGPTTIRAVGAPPASTSTAIPNE